MKEQEVNPTLFWDLTTTTKPFLIHQAAYLEASNSFSITLTLVLERLAAMSIIMEVAITAVTEVLITIHSQLGYLGFQVRDTTYQTILMAATGSFRRVTMRTQMTKIQSQKITESKAERIWMT